MNVPDSVNSRSMGTKTLSRPFELQSISEKGTFQGYGSVFGVQDWYDDVVMPGAFTRSLAEHKANGTQPLLLWQHDTKEPIGVYNSITEDERGLKVEGQLALKTQRGAEAYELLKMGAFSGLSIGFSTKIFEVDKANGIRKLKDVDLWEISPVSFAANPMAKVESIRSRVDEPTTDPRELERRLRDVLGLTQGQAKRLVATIGPRDVSSAKPDDENEAGNLLSLVRRIRIGE